MEVSDGESGFLPELAFPSSPNSADDVIGPSLVWLGSRDLTSGGMPFISMCLKIKIFIVTTVSKQEFLIRLIQELDIGL